VAPKAATLCDQTLECLKRKPMTPEEVARALGEPVHSIRPRFSQLAARKLIVKTDQRRQAMGGRMAQVWKAVS
jgi:predicted ArsR family transcriptional regulator